MKLKALFITALFVAGVASSVAVAKGPPPGKGRKAETSSSTTTTSTSRGKGKAKKSSATCRPNVTFVLKGEFVGSGAAAPAWPVPAAGGNAPALLGTFQLEVDRANNHGRTYVGKTVTISVDAKTKFKRRGHAKLADFEAGDLLNVHVRACHPKKQAVAGSGTSTTTTTTTTAATASESAAQPVMLAKHVVGRPAKSSGGDSPETESTSTETTTTSP